jgi:3',5'-cyclic AMP phosphodiesterase CpdA
VITLLHGSDLHFGRPHHPEMAEAFRKRAVEVAPDLVVLSGDFTQRAKVAEYEAARAWLDRLRGEVGVPVVVTPGNHDVPLYRVLERLLTPYRNYRTYIQEELDTVTRIPGLTVVALNSAAPRRAIVNGRIRPRQLEFARAAFEGSPAGDLRAVVAHHHLAPAPDYEGDTPLPGARRILDAFKAMGVQMVLGGHLHRAYIGNSLDVYPGPDRDRGIIIVQSGTTTSRRGRAREQAKNSFNVVRIAEDEVQVIHYMHFQEGGGFHPFSGHTFPRAPARWFGPAWAGSPSRPDRTRSGSGRTPSGPGRTPPGSPGGEG